MKKILDWLTHWEKDKILHFLCTLLVSLLAACVAKIFGQDKWTCLGAAWFAGFIVGFAKEIYDGITNGSDDEQDWAADVCGLIAGCVIVLILTF